MLNSKMPLFHSPSSGGHQSVWACWEATGQEANKGFNIMTKPEMSPNIAKPSISETHTYSFVLTLSSKSTAVSSEEKPQKKP